MAKADAEKALANARQHLKGGRTAEAAAELERGWAGLAQNLVTSLRDKVANAPKPATFTDGVAWSAFKEPIRQKLDAAVKEKDSAQQMAAYREVLGLWIAGLAESGATYMEQEALIIAQANVLGDKKAAHAAAAGQIAADLRQSAADAKIGKLGEAQAAFDTAMTAIAALRATIGPLGVAMSKSTEALPRAIGAAVPGDAGGTVRVVSASERRERRLPSRGFLFFLTTSIDVLVLAVTLVAAVLLGLQLLWQNNPVWGSSNDYIIAFLWGLGLHQISGTAFEGVTGLAEKLQK